MCVSLWVCVCLCLSVFVEPRRHKPTWFQLFCYHVTGVKGRLWKTLGVMEGEKNSLEEEEEVVREEERCCRG